jgi:hypothetical protein
LLVEIGHLWRGIPPSPSKSCKVFETDSLSLDFLLRRSPRG